MVLSATASSQLRCVAFALNAIVPSWAFRDIELYMLSWPAIQSYLYLILGIDGKVGHACFSHEHDFVNITQHL
jgi:hypothetical protein